MKICPILRSFWFGAICLLQRGTNELKKYLLSRIQAPDEETASAPKSTAPGIVDKKGTSGLIGGCADGVDKHTVASTRNLDYWQVTDVCAISDILKSVELNWGPVHIIRMQTNAYFHPLPRLHTVLNPAPSLSVSMYYMVGPLIWATW